MRWKSRPLVPFTGGEQYWTRRRFVVIPCRGTDGYWHWLGYVWETYNYWRTGPGFGQWRTLKYRGTLLPKWMHAEDLWHKHDPSSLANRST